MTEAEKNEIVGLVMTEISSQAVDFDIETEQPQANDLLTAVRQTSSGEYKGVTLKWDDVARIATELANQAATRAEQAEDDANNILTQVQSKGTEITNFVATSKAEIETQKNEAVNAVKSVYQTDLNELKGDLGVYDVYVNQTVTFENGKFIRSSDGQIATNQAFALSSNINVMPYSKVSVTSKVNNAIGYGIYDSNDSLIEYGAISNETGLKTKEITIPRNASYIRVSCYSDSTNVFLFNATNFLIALENREKYEETERKESNKKTLDFITTEIPYNKNGSSISWSSEYANPTLKKIADSTYWKLTDFIKVSPLSRIVGKVYLSSACGVALYDKFKKLVDVYSITNSTSVVCVDFDFIVKDNINYVRFSSAPDKTDNFVISQNNIVNNFEDDTRKNYLISKGRLISEFSSLNGWTMPDNNGKLSVDYKNVKNGLYSIKLEPTSNGVNATTRHSCGYDFSKENVKSLSMWVYFHNEIEDYTYLTIQLHSETLSKFFSAKINVSSIYKKGWALVTVLESDWQVYNGMTWSDVIKTISLQIESASGKKASISVDSVYFGRVWQPKIIFRFDDVNDNVYTNAFPIMNSRNISGVVYVVGSLVGSGQMMTLEHLKSLYDSGWDVGNHTYNHITFVNSTYTQIRDDIKLGQDWLIDNGFYRSARHLGVPNAINTEDAQQAYIDCGVLTATDAIVSTFSPCCNIHRIPSPAIYNTTTVNEVTSWIDKAVKNGTTLVLCFHEVTDVADSDYKYSIDNFTSVCNYIRDNDLSKYCVTMSQWYDGLNRIDSRWCE